MLTIDTHKAIKIILLFSVINSSVFLAFTPSGIGRFFIAALMNLSGVLLIVYAIKIKKIKLEINLYFKVLLFLLISWAVFTIMRSMSLVSTDMVSLFGHYLMGWAWLAPLSLVFGFNIRNWFVVFKLVELLLFVGVVLTLYLIVGGNYAVATLEWVVLFPVLLMTTSCQANRTKVILVLSVFSFLLLSYVASQRANILFISLFFSFFVIEQLRSSSVNLYKKLLIFTLIIIGNFALIIYFNELLAVVGENNVLTVDTRSFLFEELLQDMESKELTVGRGALGTYYSPYFEYLYNTSVQGGDWYHRQVNEVGYLHMILKGGYVMLILHVLILLPAAYLGIFRANNIVSRMSGYLVLSYLILWAVSYYPVYSAEYILLWMAVGTIISARSRNVSNSQLFLIKQEMKI